MLRPPVSSPAFCLESCSGSPSRALSGRPTREGTPIAWDGSIQEAAMSQSLVTPVDRRALAPLAVGLLLTVGVLAAFVVDATTWRTVAEGVVAPGGVDADATPLYVFQFLTGGLGVVGWLISLVGVALQRPWVRSFATGAFGCGLAVAAYTLMAKGFSETGFPPVWGLLLLLPCVPGALAVFLLHRPRRSA